MANPRTSKFFSSPYQPSHPTPDHEIDEKDTTATPSASSSRGSLTPLLPTTTSHSNSGAYPFPYLESSSHGKTGFWRRVRMRGRNGNKRVLIGLVCGLVLLGLVNHVVGGNFGKKALSHLLPSSHQPHTRPSIPASISSSNKEVGTRDIDFSSEALPLTATLRERLDVWKNAPGGRGAVEGEVEMGGFVQWNLEQCETIDQQHNTHMIQKSANVWATMNRTSLHTYRMDLINHMETVLKKGLTEKYGEGRGIVMVAGNADTLMRVKWSLMMLRSYESTLPVQIYHFPSESPAPDDPIRNEFKELGAELVVAVGQEKDLDVKKSYHLKALAVVQCPWREVLYLDSDSIPTRDPSYMFDSPNYKRLGIWLTPDYWKTSANNPIWAILGVKCRNEWEMETGQIFVDKKLHLDVFLLIQYMLERHEWWFYFSDGDKDIFRWALLALRKRWAVPGRWVGAAALPSGTASGDFCAHTMLQHDSYGDPLFVHYNLLKQIPSGVGRGYSWGKTKQLPLFNLWPAEPSTARLGEPVDRPVDDGRRGLGDIDCDMLADADEFGRARAEAKEMIMRRAARERGVKVRYHGGWISALCIDLEYVDPRPQSRQKEDAAAKPLIEAQHKEMDQALDYAVSNAKAMNTTEPENRGDWEQTWRQDRGISVKPDWSKSPIQTVFWRDDEHLSDFENRIYGFGFKPNGPGF